MRPLMLFLGFAVVAAAAFVLLSESDSQDGPPGGPAGVGIAPVDDPDEAIQRGEARRSSVPAQPDDEPATADRNSGDPARSSDDASADSAAADAATANLGTVDLLVADASTGQPVAEFVIVPLVQLAGLDTERRVEDSQIRLDVALDQPASVRIESPGYTPQESVDISLLGGQRARSLRVELIPAARAAGVVLFLRDDRLQPVDRLRVVAFRRPLPGQPGPDQEQRAWSRLAERADGRYELPDLTPGHWRLELSALQQDDGSVGGSDRIRPLQTADVEFDFDGNGRVERAIDLLPGAPVSLELHDPATGALLGSTAAIRLELAGGDPLTTRWLGVAPDGARVAGIDTLPVEARCDLDRALAPGNYVLQVLPNERATEPWRVEFRASPGVPVRLRLP